MCKIRVNDITVRGDRIVCLCKISNQLYSNEDIKAALLKIMPTLTNHKCKNSNGDAFVDIMSTTSLAHLLEHMIIDLQIKAIEEREIPAKPIFGTTEWINKDEGIAKIEVSYIDDIIALSAIKQAINKLNTIIANTSCQKID